MGRGPYSRYVLVVDNLASSVTSKDISYEFEACGPVRDVARDHKARCALVEFDRSSDAKYAWQKMDGFKMDGRRWKVDWANLDDFRMFGWRWFEGGRSPSPYRTASEATRPPLRTGAGAGAGAAPPRAPRMSDAASSDHTYYDRY